MSCCYLQPFRQPTCLPRCPCPNVCRLAKIKLTLAPGETDLLWEQRAEEDRHMVLVACDMDAIMSLLEVGMGGKGQQAGATQHLTLLGAISGRQLVGAAWLLAPSHKRTAT